MKNHSALKRGGGPYHMLCTIWMNFRGLYLCVKSASRTNTVKFHLYEIPRVVATMETESAMVAIRGWGEGDRYGVLDLQDKVEICYMGMST